MNNTNKENITNQPKNYNATLDSENNYGTVDFLPFIDKSHLLKLLSIEIAKATQMPVHTVFLTGLSIFSSIACRKYKVAYKYQGDLPIGLYVVAEQPSGTGKSRVTSLFQAPINKEQQKIGKDFANRIATLEKITEPTKAESSELTTLNAKPKGSFFITNSTPEALEETLKHTNGFFSTVSSEQGLFNSLLGLSYNPANVNNNDVILNGFDGGYIASHRLTRKGYIGNVVGSVVLIAQSGSIETLLDQSNGTGLAERFLLLTEQHQLGKRDHTKEHTINPDLLKHYEAICSDLVNDILAHNKTYDDLDSLKLCEKGHQLIAEYRNKLEPLLSDGGKYSHISLRGAAGKINMQIMKIAANLHILDAQPIAFVEFLKVSSGNKPEPRVAETIAIKHIDAAIKITEVLLEANLKLCIDKGILGQTAEYRAVLKYLEKQSKPVSVQILKNSLRNTLPFKNLTGDKSTAISETLTKMVADKIIFYHGDGVYSANKR